MPQDEKISELDQLVVPDPNDLLAIVDRSVNETKYITVTDLATGGIIAPADAQYVTLVADPNLTSERILTGTANQITVTDGGAGLPVTLSFPDSVVLDADHAEALLVRKDGDAGDIFTIGTIIPALTMRGNSVFNYSSGNIIQAVLENVLNDFVYGFVNILVKDTSNMGDGFGPALTFSIQDDTAGPNLIGWVSALRNGADNTGRLGFATYNTGVGSHRVYLTNNSFDFQQGTTITTTVNNLTLTPAGVIVFAKNIDTPTTFQDEVIIDGATDVVQLTVQANVAQSTNIIEIQLSDTTVVSGFDERGVLFSDAGIDVNSVYIGSDAGNIAHTNATNNVGIGSNALKALTTGDYNVGIGTDALLTETTGSGNFALGTYACRTQNTVSSNFAIGFQALRYNATGSKNVAIGEGAFIGSAGRNVIESIAIGYTAGFYGQGSFNTYIGTSSGYNNQGNSNTAIGYQAAYTGTNFRDSVYIGYRADFALTTGAYNVMIGSEAGYQNQAGGYNVVIGYEAGEGAVGNSYNGNVYVGYRAGWATTTGAYNVILGYQAGDAITASNYNVFIGYQAGTTATTGSLGNICIGYQAGDVITIGDYNIIIGYGVDPSGAAVSYELNIGDLIYGDLNLNRAGINVVPPSLAGILHIDQPSDVAALPVLVLDQADISEGFINFIGSDRGIITGATDSVESVRVELGGVVRRVALYADA